MDLIFCGTPQFAVPTLGRLIEEGHTVRLVVTQPDRPRGRGMEIAQSPVKLSATALGLPVTQPEKITNNAEFRAQIEGIKPEAIIVVGYGRIIPQWMIDLPLLGNINLHASLLPKYRGAAPIQWAIANGDNVAGNTTMRIDAGLDTGDILLQQEMRIAPDDTAITLAPRLALSGAQLLTETLAQLVAGTLRATPQDNAKASLAPILKKEDGRIDFSRSARLICDRLRGFQPWPGAFTEFRGKTLNVIAAQAANNTAGLAPSEIALAENTLLVGCGENSLLEVFELQPEGKKRMSARDFANGYQPRTGERLGVAGKGTD